jgi:heat shock protein HslJ
MKKATYVFLLLVTIPLIGYTLYYSSSHPTATIQPLLSLEATTTEELASATSTKDLFKEVLTTQTGKTITLQEENSVVEGLTSIRVIPSGFSTNTPIVLTVTKPVTFNLFDINKDSFEELVIISKKDESDTATIYTTANDAGLTSVDIPKITETDMKKGGLFEGYTGHDILTVASDTLIREFPTSTATGTASTVTGNSTKLFYVLTMSNGTPLISFSKEEPNISMSTSTPLLKTSWVWTSSTIGTTTVQAPKNLPFTLTFDTAKTFTGIANCNTLSGTYVANAKEVQLNNFISSQKKCEGISEDVYLELLTKIRSYTIEGTTTTFTLSNNGTLVFTKKK